MTSVITKASGGSVIKAVEYTYDVYDRRIAKSVDGNGSGPNTATQERFVYDGDDIALVFDGAGNQTSRYLHGPEVDQVLAEERDIVKSGVRDKIRQPSVRRSQLSLQSECHP
jgi:hypothetical protein